MQVDCPELEDKVKEKRRYNARKAMIVKFGGSDHDDDSSNDEKEEVANLCLMTLADESEEVKSSSHISISINDFNELQDIFDELHAKHMSLLDKQK